MLSTWTGDDARSTFYTQELRYYGIDENVIIDTELFYISLLTVYEKKKKDGCDIDRGNIDWIMGLHSGRVLQYERYFYFRMKF